MHVCVYVYMCVHSRVYVYVSVYECVCTCVCICECVCACVYVYVSVYECVYACVYVYVSIYASVCELSMCVHVLCVPALWPSGPAARPHGALTLGDRGWRCSQLSTLGLGLGCVREKVRLRWCTGRARRESSRGRGGAGSEIDIQREVKLTAGRHSGGQAAAHTSQGCSAPPPHRARPSRHPGGLSLPRALVTGRGQGRPGCHLPKARVGSSVGPPGPSHPCPPWAPPGRSAGRLPWPAPAGCRACAEILRPHVAASQEPAVCPPWLPWSQRLKTKPTLGEASVSGAQGVLGVVGAGAQAPAWATLLVRPRLCVCPKSRFPEDTRL